MKPDDAVTERIQVVCADGYELGAQIWAGAGGAPLGVVIINPATGVLARYYHYYARFLAAQGFTVLTYDYRGIGQSRPARLRGSGIVWRDWGALDFDAMLGAAKALDPNRPLTVVGHSIGGFLPGYAARAPMIDRMLTVGAQYAYWPDYARDARARLFVKWHMVMPLITAVAGYFPGKILGWLEDLPAGVAHEWSFRRAAMERSYAKALRPGILAGFAAIRAPILALSLTDDMFATPAAVRRGLGYYTGSERAFVHLPPARFGQAAIGHFGLFHARHEAGFWQDTLAWLRDGVNPWADGAEVLGAGR